MTTQGLSLLGFDLGVPGGTVFRAHSTASDAPLEPPFHSASIDELDFAVGLAANAAPFLAATSGAGRGALLWAIAEKMESHAALLAQSAHAETALPMARCQAEVGRTCGQLRLFAGEAESGQWADVRIEPALPERQPAPRPDLRSMLRPLGPVAVFGASNFPFAFSTAGGDTAAALAAGNPVVFKAHPAHPGTAELTGRLIVEAVRSCGFPPGTFSLIFDAGNELGTRLVRHPAIQAVAFTGSRQGGLALSEIAARREQPIPVFAEMSAVNPVFLLPGALAARGAEIALGLGQSINLGVGQFCTNPGVLVLIRSAVAMEFLAALGVQMSASSAEPMLSPGIHAAYAAAVEARAATAGVESVARGAAGEGARAQAALFATSSAVFRREKALAAEIFGPTSLVVECEDVDDLLAFAREMEGSLTATIHAAPDEELAARLAEILATRVGRLVFNGYPTGVEVGTAIVHGGPFPATSDGRSTSVGTRAMGRFARLVCWQNCPPELLPPELR